MKKNTYILIGVFVVLLAVAFLVLQKPGERSASSASTGPMFTIDSVAVDKIEIKAEKASVVLEKRGAEWYVVQPVSYKADQANVGQALHQIKVVEVKNVVSSKPEKHAVFQVDQNGTEVKLYEKGMEKAGFILGKMAGGYNEYYTRKLNSNDVLIVEGIYGYTFNRVLKDWRDRTIVAVPKENIKEVRYQYGDTTFTMTLQNSAWLVGKDTVQQSAADGMLTALSNVQADDFVDSVMAKKVTATVSYAGVQLRFSYDKAAQKFYLQSSNTPQWFFLDQWKANQILKRKKEILEARKK